MTKGKFISKCNVLHNNEYNYDEIPNSFHIKDHIYISCPIHGQFKQRADSHSSGAKCIKCTHDNLKLTTKSFMKKAKDKHSNKYDYSKVEYINSQTEVCIICPVHGEFLQTPNIHLNGSGCITCGYISNKKKQSYDTETFIQNVKPKHTINYNYSKVAYKNARTEICIICPKHGEFMQMPSDHMSGCGCPKCKMRRGPSRIAKFLDKNDIKYDTETTYEDCKDKRPLPFDFNIPSKNLLIEYDGEQHFYPITYFGGQLKYLKQIKHDIIKNEYCRINNISLLRIPYWDYDNIEAILVQI